MLGTELFPGHALINPFNTSLKADLLQPILQMGKLSIKESVLSEAIERVSGSIKNTFSPEAWGWEVTFLGLHEVTGRTFRAVHTCLSSNSEKATNLTLTEHFLCAVWALYTY